MYANSEDFTLDIHGLRLPFRSLYQNLLVTGQPGSGKSRSIIRVILRQMLKHFGNGPGRIGMLVIDPKGDTTPWLAQALKEVGRENDLQVLSPGESTFNPLDNPLMSIAQLREFIATSSSFLSRSLEGRFRADDKYWELSTRSLLQTILEVAIARSPACPLTFATVIRTKNEITQLRGSDKVANWLQSANLRLSEESKANLREFGALPDSTCACVVTGVSNMLVPWSQPLMSQLVNPMPGVPQIDLFRIIHDGACICVPIAHPALGATLAPLYTAVKEAFAQIVLSRPFVSIIENGRHTSLNSERPVLLCIDEFQRVYNFSNEAGEVNFLDMSREFKCATLLSSQNLSSLLSIAGPATTERLCGLLGTQLYLANSDPSTAAHACQILGNKRVRQLQRSYSEIPPPPLILPATDRLPTRRELSRQIMETNEPRMNPSALAQLRQGEFWAKTSSGKVSRHRALTFEL